MPTLSFALVDVFAAAPLSGNPLAVIPDADQIPEAVMPRVAQEFINISCSVSGIENRLQLGRSIARSVGREQNFCVLKPAAYIRRIRLH